MRIPGMALLCLALALILDSGVSDVQYKECRECKMVDKKEGAKKHTWVLKQVRKFERCPDSIIKFLLTNGSYCAKNDLQWVIKVVTCLENGECQYVSTSTKILNTPKTAHVSGLKITSSRNPKIIQTTVATEQETTMPSILEQKTTMPSILEQETTMPSILEQETTMPSILKQETTMPSATVHHNKNNKINLQIGNNPSKPPNPFGTEAVESKMKSMSTTIISLIVITLVMVAAGTGVYCNRKKPFQSKLSCMGRSVSYTAAPSQDTLEMEATQ